MSGRTTDPFVPGQNDRTEAEDIIERLSLSPHREGGFYRETFRDQPVHGGRGALTVIYYLLRAGERSAWHRIDAVEVWHHYAGAPLGLSLSEDGVTSSPVSNHTQWLRRMSGNPLKASGLDAGRLHGRPGVSILEGRQSKGMQLENAERVE